MEADTVIKWIIIVFIAGFIGQFGKSLTKAILRFFKKPKSSDVKSKEQYKFEKKRLKTEMKAKKN